VAVCAMMLTVWWSLHFVAFDFFFKAITATSVKSLGYSSVSHMLLISCVTILGPSSPNILCTLPGIPTFFKNIYCIESMYSMSKDKLRNCSPNQFKQIFTLWQKWNRREYKYKCK
jgi:hypothetical protein